MTRFRFQTEFSFSHAWFSLDVLEIYEKKFFFFLYFSIFQQNCKLLLIHAPRAQVNLHIDQILKGLNKNYKIDRI